MRRLALLHSGEARPHRLTVRTPAFQAVNRGSIPRGVNRAEKVRTRSGLFLYGMLISGREIERPESLGDEAGSRPFATAKEL